MAWVVCAWLGALAGCSQGKGETCQVDGDCESGLICCRVAQVEDDSGVGPSMTVRGTCNTQGTQACGLAGGSRDASTPGDANMSSEDSGL
jgi:hypothetical protein